MNFRERENMIDSASGRYEFYDFGLTEEDHFVADILVNFKELSRKSEARRRSELNWNWTVKRRRTALDSAPEPARIRRYPPPPPPARRIEAEKIDEAEKEKRSEKVKDVKSNVGATSPSSPLGFSPARADNQSNHHSKKTNSKKKRVMDWEEHIQELSQVKEQLILTVDKVKEYHNRISSYNVKLKAKKHEIYANLLREKTRRGIDLHVKMEQQHLFPLFAQQQQELVQQTSLRYLQFYQNFPNPPSFPASSGGGMRMLNQKIAEENYGRMVECRRRFEIDDKINRAADARKRRMVKINQKKNSGGDKRNN